ncbi:Uncharacterised protein [uncultured archaeon]|nr:Uncharacterised protein [uncultured archaeon]
MILTKMSEDKLVYYFENSEGEKCFSSENGRGFVVGRRVYRNLNDSDKPLKPIVTALRLNKGRFWEITSAAKEYLSYLEERDKYSDTDSLLYIQGSLLRSMGRIKDQEPQLLEELAAQGFETSTLAKIMSTSDPSFY